MLALAVAFASMHYARSTFAGGFFPLTAIGVCAAVVPLAAAARWRVTARATQAAYLALASLTPWLVFAWPVEARMDVDGDGGGALGASAIGLSAFPLLLVTPVTLHVLLRTRTLRARV